MDLFDRMKKQEKRGLSPYALSASSLPKCIQHFGQSGSWELNPGVPQEGQELQHWAHHYYPSPNSWQATGFAGTGSQEPEQ